MMQEDSCNAYAWDYKYFDSGIRHEKLGSMKVQGELDACTVTSKISSASSLARKQEMIELQLKAL